LLAAPHGPKRRCRRLALAGGIGMLLAVPFGPPMAAAAEAWQATYDAYVAGANAARLTTLFHLDTAGYRMDVQARTLGLLDVFVGARQSTQVDGTWHEAQLRPRQFRAEGVWKGERRVTRIDYHAGDPRLQELAPADPQREAVPAAARLHAMDRLSPLALLARQVARTGQCDTRANTYDGRRLEETTSRTAGWDDLPPSSISSFAGRALRCDIEIRMTAGFLADEDRAHAGRLRHAQVWLAAPAAGAPMLPVRFQLDAGWLGHATVYLSAFSPAVSFPLR